MRSSSAWVPMPLTAAAQSTGMILPVVMPARSALSISGSSSDPDSRYLLSNSSSVSAAASTSFSRYSRAWSAMSPGMSASRGFPSV